jgi:predicted ATP-dependent Lon-type protease
MKPEKPPHFEKISQNYSRNSLIEKKKVFSELLTLMHPEGVLLTKNQIFSLISQRIPRQNFMQ